MKWQYKLSLLLLLVSQTSFLVLAAYHTDTKFYSSSNRTGTSPSLSYSWIWYHLEHWIISLVFALGALFMFIHGIVSELWQTRGVQQTFDKQATPTNRSKFFYVALLVIVWVVVIFLGLYFAGFFNPK
jgi:hypothetical protein